MKTYLGLDIGKTEIFDAYPSENGIVKVGKFYNTETGIQKFIQSLDSSVHGIMESTGLYHFP